MQLPSEEKHIKVLQVLLTAKLATVSSCGVLIAAPVVLEISYS